MLANTRSLCPRQIADVQVQVSQNTEALQGAQTEMGDLSRQIQTLEIELASQQSLVSMHFLCVLYSVFIHFRFIRKHEISKSTQTINTHSEFLSCSFVNKGWNFPKFSEIRPSLKKSLACF